MKKFALIFTSLFSIGFLSSVSAPQVLAQTATVSGDPACVRSGCNNELCVRFGSGMNTSCVYRPEFACYQQATCEMNTQGNCAFTITSQVQACLDNTLASPTPSPTPSPSANPNASLTPSPFASPSPTTYPSGPINWTTTYNSLSSPRFTIVTPNGVFVGATDQLLVHADPGNPNYQTLEATWRENGVEMRMNIYLAQQNGYWRVTEFRTYDGAANGDWLFYDGTPFGVMPSNSWVVTDHFSFPSRDGRGRVIMDNMVLKAFLNNKIPGDLNNDGKVNLIDYSIMVNDLFKTGTNLEADINQDGKVNLLDYSILVTNLST